MATPQLPPGTNIYTTPAARPPNGVFDFDSPDHNGDIYAAVSGVFLGFTALFVALKIYARVFVQKSFGLDDVCTIGAFILQATYIVIVDRLFLTGGARHQWDMSISTFMWVQKQQQMAAKIQMPTYLLTKLALLFLFYRLFSPKSVFRWAIIIGCVLMTMTYISVMFIYIFVKVPLTVVRTGNGLACLNLISDVYLLVLPMAAVSTLKLPLSRKIGLGAVFGAGLLAVAMSALALYYRFETLQGKGSTDTTYTVPPKAVAVTVEICVGIMVGCFPVLPSLFKSTNFKGFVSSSYSSIKGRLLSLGSTNNSNSRVNQSQESRSSGDDEYPLSRREKPMSLHSTSAV